MNPISPTEPQARILVVDDEDRVREGLCWSLRVTGYQVDEASSGLQALGLLHRSAFDLMLLDMNMPAMDGVEVMERARRVQPDLAIIVLTGHATLDSAIAAVKWGASDYLLKPVGIQSLQAAVGKALIERADLLRQKQVMALMGQVTAVLHPTGASAVEPAPPVESVSVLRVGSLALDLGRRIASVDGPDSRSAELTEAEAAILQELMRRPEQVRTCRQLVYSAWGYDVSEAEAAGAVRSHLFRLRKKIEIDSQNPQFIKTVRGGGYFLAKT